MKIRLTYYKPIVKEMEMTPQEYCHFYCNPAEYYPDGAINKDYEIADNKSINELNDFWRKKS